MKIISKFVSKEEAKKMIDASPSNTVCITIIDTETHTSGNTELIKKLDSYKLIENAKTIDYENHDIFGRLQLMNILKEPNILRCITFAQQNDLIE